MNKIWFSLPLLAGLLTAAPLAASTVHVLEDNFQSYSTTDDLGLAWPVNSGTTSVLGTDPENPYNRTVHNTSQGRRIRTFDPITPTDDQPLHLAFRLFDTAPGTGARQWVMISNSSVNAEGTRTYGRLFSLGMHNSVTTGTFNVSRFQVRELAGVGRQWTQLSSPRRAGWNNMQLIIKSNTFDVIINGVADASATGLNWSGGSFNTITIGPEVTSTVAVHYDNVVVTRDASYNPAPVQHITLSAQPESTEGALSSSATFSASAVGQGLTYRWHRNNVALTDDDRISGSTTPALTINSIQASDFGNYSLWVAGTLQPEGVFSRIATLSEATAKTLLLRYAFDESETGTDPALDSGAAPAAPGTFVGTATRTGITPGNFSKGALDLSKTAAAPNLGRVESADPEKLDGLAKFTLTSWINVQDLPITGNRRILAKQTASTFQGISWQIADPLNGTTRTPSNFGMRLFVGTNGTGVTGDSGLNANIDADKKWVFLAVTYDGTLTSNNVKYYIGNEAGEVSLVSQTTINAGVIPATTAAFTVGATEGAIASDLAPKALLDDVRVYSGVLSRAELDSVRRENLVSTTPPATGFAAWRTSQFTGSDASNDAISGPLATPAGDGVPNLLKYALRLSPQTSSRHLLPKPQVQTLTVSGVSAQYVTISVTHRSDLPDAMLVAEANGNLHGTWSPAVIVDTVTNGDGSHTTLYRDSVPVTSAQRRFIRVRATAN